MCTNVHSFDYLLKYFIADRVLAKATIKHYKLVIKLFQEDTKIHDVRDIDKLTILEWRNNVYERASASTSNNYIRHMKALFNCAVENELLDKNPFEKVRSIATHEKSNRSTTLDDVSKAINFLQDESQDSRPGWFWILVIRTFHFTGMRRRQLAELRWKDIDFETRLINLRVEASKTKREWDIPLNDEIIVDSIKKRNMGYPRG